MKNRLVLGEAWKLDVVKASPPIVGTTVMIVILALLARRAGTSPAAILSKRLEVTALWQLWRNCCSCSLSKRPRMAAMAPHPTIADGGGLNL